jgi:predicted RNA polymerase sigma factor
MDAAATYAEIPDQRLALMLACSHPAIDAGIRAPLILQVVLGLDAKMIASAFLTSPEAMGKRLVRAKDKIRQAHSV